MITTSMRGTVKCKKSIGSFESGTTYNDIETRAMNGKRYKPGKHKNGKWLDVIGQPEDRVMIFSAGFFGLGQYAVGTLQELNRCFDTE